MLSTVIHTKALYTTYNITYNIHKVGEAIAHRLLKTITSKTMTKLHHKSARYELQIWRPNTLSWKPIAHEHEYDVAVERMQKLAKNNSDKTYRILDRKDGAHRATEVAQLGNK